jgi:N utilization substance protein B
MSGTRRKARTIALKTLYEVDSAARVAESVLERYFTEENLADENKAFIRELVSGVVENKTAIDENIRKFAPAWPVDQLALVDRNILRLAIFEILFDNEVPVKVAVSEAVELAKTFGSKNSSRFINGVLGAVSAIASR